jgi:hypothetical protein
MWHYVPLSKSPGPKKDERSLLRKDIVPLMFNGVLALNENTSMDRSTWMSLKK